MNTKILVCLAYVIPTILGASETEGEKVQTLISCNVKQELFASTEDDEKTDVILPIPEKEDGKDALATNDEDKEDEKLPLVEDKKPEPIV